jgi:hypothetical protein
LHAGCLHDDAKQENAQRAILSPIDEFPMTNGLTAWFSIRDSSLVFRASAYREIAQSAQRPKGDIFCHGGKSEGDL